MWSSTLQLGAVLSLATIAAADSMYVTEICIPGCTRPGGWHTDFGHFLLYNLNDGCHGGGDVPGLETICIDYGRARAHFKFSHQNFKRCMKGDWTRDDCGLQACGTWWFNEVPCTWREALELDDGSNANSTEEVNSVSALPEPTAEAEPLAGPVRIKV